MKNLYWLWLLLCFCFRLTAQTGNSADSVFIAVQMDSLTAIEKMISDVKTISATDTQKDWDY